MWCGVSHQSVYVRFGVINHNVALSLMTCMVWAMNDLEFDQQVGRNVARLRVAKELSQADVAQALTDWGVPWHQQTQQKVERGARPLRLQEAVGLAEVLRVDTQALYGEEEVVDGEVVVQQLARQVNLLWNGARGTAYTYGRAHEELLRAVKTHGEEVGVETMRLAMEYIGRHLGTAMMHAASEGRDSVLSARSSRSSR
jgi:transcriptional regulator with XRE-family HTH domain